MSKDVNCTIEEYLARCVRCYGEDKPRFKKHALMLADDKYLRQTEEIIQSSISYITGWATFEGADSTLWTCSIIHYTPIL